MASSLYVPTPRPDGVIEQFDGFFRLGDYQLPAGERFKAPVSRLFDWEEINRLKILKQADVLMLPLLFPDDFSDEVVMANYRYYEPLTDHGSSLSPAVHAAIAARVGLRDDAERYLNQALWLDLSNAMDNSMLGVHPAAMGGVWQAVVFGFLGVRFTDTGPKPDARAAARLPSGWQNVELALAWRDRLQRVMVERLRQSRRSFNDPLHLHPASARRFRRGGEGGRVRALARGIPWRHAPRPAHDNAPAVAGGRIGSPGCASGARCQGDRPSTVRRRSGGRPSGDRRPSHRPCRDELPAANRLARMPRWQSGWEASPKLSSSEAPCRSCCCRRGIANHCPGRRCWRLRVARRQQTWPCAQLRGLPQRWD